MNSRGPVDIPIYFSFPRQKEQTKKEIVKMRHETSLHLTDMFIYKRACLDGPCGPCDINRYCADAGESYSYLISCVTSDGRLTTGTASQTSSLLFYADIDPPFSFDPNSMICLQKMCL
ncbi:hypothetical protein DPMN_051055 [Dreissena polymorpha]|uniref:Uncharacterized protein n=1 Tax=Dreissena polymorpha TaxID=45954 RepID=A0A9D4CH78_DREPO|nr:hypothetical protein DPMN_051055 [Dreissena polymorpha]